MTPPPPHFPRILLLGARGQLGRALVSSLGDQGALITAGRRAGDDVVLDLENPRSIRRALAATRPDLVVNAAAYTAVDTAESARDRCMQVNARGPAELATATADVGGALVHISTDYVFDGRQRHPYGEHDTATPRNVYGASKLAGEQAVLSTDVPCLILRTSWLYSRRGPSFVTTMARLLASEGTISVVDDQVGAPTWTHDLAHATSQLLRRWRPREPSACRGVLHVASRGQATWFEVASEMARMLGSTTQVTPTTTRAWGAPAQRPAYSVLDTNRLYEQFGLRLPHWQTALAACLETDALLPDRLKVVVEEALQ